MQKNNENNKKIEFKKLTAKVIEKDYAYKKALDYVFREDDILNVALTGIYGAGKSSVWMTYEKGQADDFCIHISLANFCENKDNNEDKDNNDKNKKRMEGHIVNQLIHQIEKNKIPFTKFKVKNPLDKNFKFFRISLIGILIASLALTFKVDIFNFIKKFLVNFEEYYITIISLISIILSSSYIISVFLKHQFNNPLIKKLSYNKNELELFTDEKDSILDKNLDEIIYILQNSNIKAIVFEDLDRYNDINIFSKLREINFLLNKKIEINNKKKFIRNFCKKIMKKIFKKHKSNNIKFIYLLKDNMFKSKNRTKFFDFIIPIVPVIDTNNSKSKIAKIFDNELQIKDNKSELDKIFVERLSYYIDDMRILHNIYNEYVIYKNQINAEERELDFNKLLAIITYKNIFPEDFSNLQVNKGYVNYLFKKKNEIIDIKINKLKKDIENKKEIIERLNMAIEDSLVELISIFMNNDRIYSNIEGETNRDIVKNILEKDDDEILNYAYSYGTNYEYKEQIIDYCNKNEEFKKRKEDIGCNTKKERITLLEQEIIELEEETKEIPSKKLVDIIADLEEDIFLLEDKNDLQIDSYLKNIRKNHYFGLIKFLITSGKLNELYFEYMGYFYTGSLKENDKKFQLAVLEGDKKEFDYKLENAKEVLRGFQESDFIKSQILNYDLLDAIIDTENNSILKTLLETVKKKNTIEFINGYLNTREINYKEKLIIFINEEINDFSKVFFMHERISNEVKNIYAKISAINSQSYFEQLNKDNMLTNYFNSNDSIFENLEENKEAIMKNSLVLLGVKLKYLSKLQGELSERVIKGIIENDLYEITFSNINFIIKKLRTQYNEEEIIRRNYSILMEEEFHYVLAYINDNIDVYLSTFNDNNKNILYKNDLTATIDLLNSEATLENKIKFIEKNKTKIDIIDTINFDLNIWRKLIQCKILKANYFNVLVYLNKLMEETEEKELDDEIIAYLNSFGSNEIQSMLENEYTSIENIDNLEFELLKSNKLNDEIYIAICKRANDVFEVFDLKHFSYEKIKALIETNKLEMNCDNFTFVCEFYENNTILFIKYNLDSYIKLIFNSNAELLNEDLIIKIINSSELENDEKIKVISYYDECISLKEIENKNSNVSKYILEEKFCESDLEFLVQNYDDMQFKELIINIFEENIDKINFKYKNSSFINDLLSSKDVNETSKIKLISKVMDENTPIEDIKKLFNIANLEGFKDIFKKRRPTIEINEFSKLILEVLKEKEIVSTYSQEDGVYRVNPKKNITSDDEVAVS